MEEAITVEVLYRCRDNGHGVEEGMVRGHWTGEVDTWGKRTFQPSDGSPAMYFFDDEILSETADLMRADSGLSGLVM
jgi:hypothetical protein